MKHSIFKIIALTSLLGLTVVSTVTLASTKPKSNKFYGVLSAIKTNPAPVAQGVLFAPYQIRIDNDSNYDLQASVVGTSFTQPIPAGDALSIKNNTPVGAAEIDITENGEQFFDQMVYNHSCVEVHSAVDVQVIQNCLQ